MPTSQQIAEQMRFDLATKKALEERGDREDETHIIEHHFTAQDREPLDAIARIGRMLGFEAGDVRQMQAGSGTACEYFDLTSASPTYLNDLARQSLLMLTLAEAYGAVYDGWGTLVVRD